MYRWGKVNNLLCSLCNLDNEDKNHLFFTCEYSKYIWDNLYLSLSIPISTSHEFNDILEFFTDKVRRNNFFIGLVAVILTTFVWHLWLERNHRIFKNKKLPPPTRFWMILQDCKILMNKSINQSPAVSIIECISSSVNERNSEKLQWWFLVLPMCLLSSRLVFYLSCSHNFSSIRFQVVRKQLCSA